jgi:histidine ammonia-lyase
MAALGSISERRTAALLDPNWNYGLPAFLVHPKAKPGLHSGLMIVQYTQAALVAENKLLCQPASPDSIPSSANQEDEVSMGLLAARWALQMAQNLSRILACELLCSVQGLLIRRGYVKETRAAEEIGRHAVMRPDAMSFAFVTRQGEFKLGKGTAEMLERAQSIAHLPITKDTPLAEIVETLAESLAKE